MTYPLIALSEVLVQFKEYIETPEPKIYPKLSVKLYGKGVILDAPVDGSSLKMQRHQIAKSGQVILSEIWGKKGAIGFVPIEGDGALCTSHFFLFDIDRNKLEPKYLQAIFTANYLENQLGGEARGTTGYAAVRPKHLLASKIPLPPIEEQRRIVAYIENLATQIEEARGLRKGAIEEAEALLRTVTTEAFYFENNTPVSSIGDLCDVRGGIQKSSKRLPGQNSYRYLTVAHVQRNYIDTGDPRYFEITNEELERWRLMSGDILVVEGNGSAEQIGRAALFRDEIKDCVHQNHIIRVRPQQDKLLPEYINLYLNSSLGRNAILEISRTSSGLFHLSVGRIKEISLPLPSLHIQLDIVSYINNLQAEIDELKQLQMESAAELNALLPSILDKAFKGEL